MRVVVIDPFNREIREEDVNPRLFVVGPVAGGCLDPGFLISGNALLYVHRDDAVQSCFMLAEQNIFHGFGLVTGGHDKRGSPRAARLSVKDVAAAVQFLKPSADGLGYIA
jgi:hypothetical protein